MKLFVILAVFLAVANCLPRNKMVNQRFVCLLVGWLVGFLLVSDVCVCFLFLFYLFFSPFFNFFFLSFFLLGCGS